MASTFRWRGAIAFSTCCVVGMTARAPSASWLDAPKPASWNKPGLSIPTAPRLQEASAFSSSGWNLVGAYQGGWQTRVIRATANYDGMCRPRVSSVRLRPRRVRGHAFSGYDGQQDGRRAGAGLPPGREPAGSRVRPLGRDRCALLSIENDPCGVRDRERYINAAARPIADILQPGRRTRGLAVHGSERTRWQSVDVESVDARN